jgi:NADH-quinone oxidoreductase subunit D
MDYVGAMCQELGYVLTVEKLMGLTDFPDRLHYIRVLMAELQRVASHLLAVGTYGLDIGAITPFLWCFRDREKILDLFEWVSGARLLYNYLWIGGVAHDLPAGYLDKVREFVEYFTPRVQELNDLLSLNKIFIERTAHIGVMPPGGHQLWRRWAKSARQWRALGSARKSPTASNRLDFDVPVGSGEFAGAQRDATWCACEILESLKIIRQVVDQMPSGDPMQGCPGVYVLRRAMSTCAPSSTRGNWFLHCQ